MKTNYILCVVCLMFFVACSSKQHLTTNTHQTISDYRQQNTSHTSILIDSILQTLSLSADSLIIEIAHTGSADVPVRINENESVSGALVVRDSYPSQSVSSHSYGSPKPSLRIIAHNPHLSATQQKQHLALAQTEKTDSTAVQNITNIHASTSKDVVGVARPMNGTLVTVIVLLAVLTIATTALFLFLRKYKIL